MRLASPFIEFNEEEFVAAFFISKGIRRVSKFGYFRIYSDINGLNSYIYE